MGVDFLQVPADGKRLGYIIPVCFFKLYATFLKSLL